MIVYVETSVAARLLVEEEASARLPEHLDALPDPPVSSLVLETELRRLAVRLDLAQTAVTTVLEQFDPLESAAPCTGRPGCCPDATSAAWTRLHVAAAPRLDADIMVSYDLRQVAAAEAVGFRTLAL